MLRRFSNRNMTLMTASIIPRTTQNNNAYILYDESAITNPDIELFDPDQLNRHAEIIQIGTGRGSAWYVNADKHQWVLRHYLRGGFISRFIIDTYWSASLNSSRSWHEWNLLKQLYTKGLPVPRPVAACVKRRFGFYHADILVEKIANAQTMAEILGHRKLTSEEWENIAATIKRFHDHGVYHADLNANNILLNEEKEVYIIDFDRGQIRKPGPWKAANLIRLERSLNKIRNSQKQFLYQNSDWKILQNTYDKK